MDAANYRQVKANYRRMLDDFAKLPVARRDFTPILMVPWTREMVWVKSVGGVNRPWASIVSTMSFSLPRRKRASWGRSS